VTEPTTNLWTIEAPRPGADMRDWSAKKDEALRAIVLERQEMECTCEAPPWVSPPGEWPMKIVLVHNDDCGTPVEPDDSALGRLAARNRASRGHIGPSNPVLPPGFDGELPPAS
jgi:hypothetical protein